VIIRTNVANISQTGRAAQGVKVMRLDDEAQIVTFALVDPVIEDEEVDAPELTDETISTDNNEE
ncbi:DNA gyrase C-terminal beta-propeller domain-containing protein, partial [Lactococcus lactis]